MYAHRAHLRNGAIRAVPGGGDPPPRQPVPVNPGPVSPVREGPVVVRGGGPPSTGRQPRPEVGAGTTARLHQPIMTAHPRPVAADGWSRPAAVAGRTAVAAASRHSR